VGKRLVEKKKEKLNPEEHYFKIDSKILNLSKEALSKKELLVYILHCRTINPNNKFMGCSVAKFTRAREVFNLSKETYQKALDMLIAKNLLEIRPDIKTGIYREAVEVLNFPIYNLEDNTFKIDESKEDNHRRRYKGTKYINVPSIIIDKGYLKGLKLQDIWAILWLYNNLDMSENLGVSHELVHAYNSDYERGYKSYNTYFGDGFHKSIHKKLCIEVLIYKEYWFSKDLDNFQGNKTEAFNSLIERGLFTFVPILIEYDEEDDAIITVKNEIFKGLVRFEKHIDSEDKYLLVEPERNQKIVWIMRPTISIFNEDFSYYLNRINGQRATQEDIYCNVDIRTHRSKKISYIKSEEFRYFLIDNDEYEDIYNKIIEIIGERQLENLFYNNYDIERERINEEISKKKDLIGREKETINKRNKETGERHKTSDLKKQLDKELNDLLIKERQYERVKAAYEMLFDKIINLIPDNIFLHYENYKIKAEIE
jgi:hypothetical protein